MAESKTNLLLKVIATGIDKLSSPTVSVSSYQTADIDIQDTFSDSFLIGQVESTGLDIWLIKRIQDVAGNFVFTYALESNNPTKTTYADAWADKLNLTYDAPEGLNIP